MFYWHAFFIHNTIQARVTHKTCTTHLTWHYRLSNSTVLHHRSQVSLTIQDILWHVLCTVFCRILSSYECKHENNQHFRLYSLDYQNMSKFMINYDLSERELGSTQPNPPPHPLKTHMTHRLALFDLHDGIKLLDCFRWRYEYTQGKNHFASCPRAKPCIRT